MHNFLADLYARSQSALFVVFVVIWALVGLGIGSLAREGFIGFLLGGGFGFAFGVAVFGPGAVLIDTWRASNATYQATVRLLAIEMYRLEQQGADEAQIDEFVDKRVRKLTKVLMPADPVGAGAGHRRAARPRRLVRLSFRKPR